MADKTSVKSRAPTSEPSLHRVNLFHAPLPTTSTKVRAIGEMFARYICHCIYTLLHWHTLRASCRANSYSCSGSGSLEDVWSLSRCSNGETQDAATLASREKRGHWREHAVVLGPGMSSLTEQESTSDGQSIHSRQRAISSADSCLNMSSA